MVSIPIFDLPKVDEGHELQRRQIRHWMAFFMAYHMLKIYLFQPAFMLSTNEASGQTHTTHLDKPTIAVGENAMSCISPKHIYLRTRFTAPINQALVELPLLCYAMRPRTDGRRPRTDGLRPRTDGRRPRTDGRRPASDGRTPA